MTASVHHPDQPAAEAFARWASLQAGAPGDARSLIEHIEEWSDHAGLLDTEIEGRSIVWKSIPARGRVRITEPAAFLEAVDPWSLKADSLRTESNHVATCAKCGGERRSPCVACCGTGKTLCGGCDGQRVAALMITTRSSLASPEAVVDEYAGLGFTSIFLRPLSPYGFARRRVSTTGYTMREFLDFYVRAVDHILAVNARGTSFVETYAQLLVYNYDGDVYASAEARMLAEMGDRRFRLGNVHRHSYETIFGGETLRRIVTASVAESILGCADCAFLPWCGADPVRYYATTGDLVPGIPAGDFHEKHSLLFRHLLTLYDRDATARRIFWSWVCDDPRQEEVA